MYNPLTFIRRIGAWFSTGLSNKAKIIIISVLFIFSLGTLYAAYKVNDYFENNPNACSTCHVHDKANKAWVTSEHSGINCHECHHSTKIDQMRQLYQFVVLGHNKVSPRHGEVIVPWKLCFSCHWERNEKYPKAPDISRSRYHAKHVFIERIECTKCHGYRTHQFSLEERYCLTCHKGKEVHGTGMEKLACLNCHTDRTSDLRPGRKKCLFCHGDESVRKELLADATLDVTHYQPDQKTINKAIKIVVPEKAPMQFDCYQCHKPHKSSRPDWGNCLSCHENIINVGKHNTHVQVMGMKCKQCHKPHIWRVSAEQAKKDCVTCHEYREPKSFIGTQAL
jgi:nitrate reductase cytochrome c-type subunit